jgi:hypothetical protein
MQISFVTMNCEVEAHTVDIVVYSMLPLCEILYVLINVVII